jgi:hypothetical protein
LAIVFKRLGIVPSFFSTPSRSALAWAFAAVLFTASILGTTFLLFLHTACVLSPLRH